MIILGIETSCDDTSLALVEDGKTVLGHVTASQVEIHNKTGGVVPEVAAREHVRAIIPVYDRLLMQSNKTIQDIDAIAVTQGPGLVSSLIIGDSFGSTLSLLENKPIIPTQHIEGHIYANWLERDEKDFHFPIVILTASGGHNELLIMHDHGIYEHLGRTKDDAAGEAFDKVARILGLSYPGGPSIQKAGTNGNKKAFDLPRPMKEEGFDFSFSGLKSEALRRVENELQKNGSLDEQFIADFAASFQECVVDVLSYKLFKAAEKYKVQEVHLTGGVSANLALRQRIEEMAHAQNILSKSPLQIPYCMDNGAMIAACAYFHYRKNPENYTKWQNVTPNPNLSCMH